MYVSAYVQQKSKLSPECFEHIFYTFNQQLSTKVKRDNQYKPLAIDGFDFNQV